MLLHLLGLQFFQVLCLRAQASNFRELQVQVHSLFTKVLKGNVKHVIVRDGSDCQAWDCRGRGFHIFKIARNFNFSFNYEIPYGDFIIKGKFKIACNFKDMKSPPLQSHA